MNIFFDVDSTLVARDGSLRPRVTDVFQRLLGDGHTIYVWSGVGLRWEVLDRHSLRPYVAGVFLKPLYDYHRGLISMGVTVQPDFCVDDYPEIVWAFGGAIVAPYEYPDPSDKEMERVYQTVQTFQKKRQDGSAPGP